MRQRRAAFLLCAVLMAAAVLPPTASANSAAPEPIVTVKVKHAPEGEYCLALLTGEADRTAEDPENGGPALPADLSRWTGEGWYPALVQRKEQAVGTAHAFSVRRLPRDFRVAVSAADGAQISAETVHREAYYTTVVYDCAAGRVTYVTPVWLAYAVQFLCTCLPTLALEGAVLVFLFRFDWKKNWKLFLTLNLATQIFLTWCMTGQYVGNGDRGYPGMLLIAAELPIFIAEAVVCAVGLKGRSRGWRFCYALTANGASLAFGLAVNPALFRLLQRL